jgi:hypothetical protein
MRAEVEQAAIAIAERTTRELIQRAVEAAETVHRSAAVAAEEKLTEALTAVHGTAERVARETRDSARATLEGANVSQKACSGVSACSARMVPPWRTTSASRAPSGDSAGYMSARPATVRAKACVDVEQLHSRADRVARELVEQANATAASERVAAAATEENCRPCS